MHRILFGLLLALAFGSDLEAQTPFYQGKTITLLVGSSAGSTYDNYARFIAHHLGKHIPGNPALVVQNMSGAGSMIAANNVYSVAKPDGLTIASINPALYFNQLAGKKEIQFDWSKFVWLGSPDRSDHLLYMRADTPFKTIQDVRRASEPPRCSATGTGTTGHYLPKLLGETIGTKFNIVLGYQGAPEMDLAAERGETQCRALTHAAWFSGQIYGTWRANGFARVLMQTGRKRDERLPQVPTLNELMNEYRTDELSRRLATVVLSSNEFGRPYVTHPATPSEQIKILREAFVKTMADPEFLAEAKKKNLDLEPTPGEELGKLAKEVISQPPEVIGRMKKLLEK
jgi:tripartite-type tricarboxylate transporter receptor subunit TctC